MQTQTDIFTYMVSPRPSAAKEGLLSGKSAAVQPNMSVRGWPTEAGSKALERFVALEDAAVVERLRQAGAAIIGSTRMSELGLGLAGDTGCKALAEGHVDLALITDTMGEARVAAAAAGVFGIKPSYGIVSRFGLIGLVPSMEGYGIAAKTPEDLAAVTAAITGGDERDFSMAEEKIPDFRQAKDAHDSPTVVGVIREIEETLESGESRAFRAALSRLRETGLKTEEVSLPDFALSRTIHNLIGSVEASSSGGKYDGVRYGHRTASAKDWNEMYLRSRAGSFGLLIKTYLFQGAYFQFRNYTAFENACRIRARLVRETETRFKMVDVFAFPTRRASFDAAGATTVNAVYDAFSLTLFANLTGLPAVHIPGLVFEGGTDLGLQIVGPRLSEARLLSLARLYQKVALQATLSSKRKAKT